jgi:hypothetical protein
VLYQRCWGIVGNRRALCTLGNPWKPWGTLGYGGNRAFGLGSVVLCSVVGLLGMARDRLKTPGCSDGFERLWLGFLFFARTLSQSIPLSPLKGERAEGGNGVTGGRGDSGDRQSTQNSLVFHRFSTRAARRPQHYILGGARTAGSYVHRTAAAGPS